ncbi:hypothetical protein M3D51_11455, partial [Micrococcus luteus]|nr:hypothetical protein [Micrococcus luteus]
QHPLELERKRHRTRDASLVTTTAEGRNVWYALADPRLGQTLGELLKLTLTIDPDCCSAAGCTCA